MPLRWQHVVHIRRRQQHGRNLCCDEMRAFLHLARRALDCNAGALSAVAIEDQTALLPLRIVPVPWWIILGTASQFQTNM
jgi:hypothetical protein